MKIQRALLIMSSITFSLITVMLVLYCYWMFWPNQVMKTTGIAQTNRLKYYPGENLDYTFKYCKFRPIVGTVTRALVDGTRTTFNTIQSDLPAGCHEPWICSLRIPRNTPQGIYHLEITGEYKVNPLRTEINRLRSNDFEVIGVDPSTEFWNWKTQSNSNRLDELERK
jgi:hypothetical protein